MSKRPSESPLSAWQEASNFPDLFRAFGAVISALIFRPADFFRACKDFFGPSVGFKIAKALAFALILGYLKLALDIANIFWIKNLAKIGLFPGIQSQLSSVALAVVHSPFFLLRPLFSILLTFLFVAAGIKLVLGFDKPLLPAFFIVCYKSASEVFYVLPLAGGIFASIWAMAILVIGVRQCYGINVFRSVLSALVMPFLLLFFIAVSVGPTINRTMLRFYPELRSQIIRFNETTAYMYTAAISTAAENYRKELGFYPTQLGSLKKFMPGGSGADISSPDNATGYIFSYTLLDKDHFIIKAFPSRGAGRFVFYSDETGKVRLNDASGPVVENLQDLEKLEN